MVAEYGGLILRGIHRKLFYTVKSFEIFAVLLFTTRCEPGKDII